MSQPASAHDDEDRFTSRPARQAISEILGMSIMGVVASLVLMTFPFDEGFLERGLRRVQPFASMDGRIVWTASARLVSWDHGMVRQLEGTIHTVHRHGVRA